MTEHIMPECVEGEKIVCVDASLSYEKLIEGDVYTIARVRNTPGLHALVDLVELPEAAFKIRRFRKHVVDSTPPSPASEIAPGEIAIDNGPDTHEPGPLCDEVCQPGLAAEEEPLKPGDWVRVIGQVVKADGPGDILVEFYSHNEQWNGWVEEDRVAKTSRPAWADAQCTAVTVNVLDSNILYRCEKPEHRRFDKDHKSGKYKWVDGDNSGFFEEA